MSIRSIATKSWDIAPAIRDASLLLIVAVTLVEVMGTMSVGAALPGIAETFKLAPQQIGLVMTAFVLPILIGAPICGVLADRFGRKVILVPSLMIFALGGVASAFAPSFEALLLFRFLQGVGAASLEALALALLADRYTGRQLTTAMGINAAMIALGLIVYPLVSGLLASFGWRYVFVLPFLAVLVGMWMAVSLDESARLKTANFALRPYLADMLRSMWHRQVIGVLALITLIFVLLFGPFLTFVPMIAATHGASEPQIGLLIAVMAFAFGLMSMLLGALSRRLSRVAIMLVALVAYTLALALTPIMPSALLLVIPSMFFGIGHGLVFPMTQTMLAELAPRAGKAGFLAVVAMAAPFGQTLGPLMSSAVIGVLGLADGFFAWASCTVVVGVFWLAAHRAMSGTLKLP